MSLDSSIQLLLQRQISYSEVRWLVLSGRVEVMQCARFPVPAHIQAHLFWTGKGHAAHTCPSSKEPTHRQNNHVRQTNELMFEFSKYLLKKLVLIKHIFMMNIYNLWVDLTDASSASVFKIV